MQSNLITPASNAKQPIERHPRRPGSDWGIVRRVARKLGKSASLVSAVKNGYAKSAKVSAALEEERELMRREEQERRSVA